MNNSEHQSGDDSAGDPIPISLEAAEHAAPEEQFLDNRVSSPQVYRV
jgi:hypothetical protein